MAKLKLNPDPTFPAKVDIPLHGGGTDPVSFTFKHRSRDEMKQFLESLDGMKDHEIILAVATGWELVEEFNAENMQILAQNYNGAPKAIYDKYVSEIVQAREKN